MTTSDGAVIRARVSLSRGERCRVLIDSEEYDALVRGSLFYNGDVVPVTGDWVRVRPVDRDTVLIEEVLPRRSEISRRAAGRESRLQVLAANVDLAFLVCGLDLDFNVRRLERYLAIAYDGGVEPVVVLNKADLCPDIHRVVEACRTAAGQSSILIVSAATGVGVKQMTELLTPGVTAVLLGSSGAGKSSLLNRIIGAWVHQTGPVRESDSRGRHTTTDRELIVLPSGAALIDTPGLREIQLAVGEESLEIVFDEIAALSSDCRFADCTHSAEPGCAVRDAVSAERLESFHKLRREAERLTGSLTEKQRWRSIHKATKRFYRDRGYK